MSAVAHLMGPGLVLAVAGAVLARIAGCGMPARGAAALAGAALLLLPAGPSALGPLLRAWLGDLSIPNLALLVAALASGIAGIVVIDRRNLATILMVAGISGLLLYPLAFGLAAIDPYRLGYDPLLLPAALLPLCVAGWLSGRRAAIGLLLAALVGFHLDLLESQNLWDYLVDPWLVLWAWSYAMLRLLRPRWLQAMHQLLERLPARR